MQHPLVILWQTFFDLCRFRRAPQDLPYSHALLGVTILITFCIDISVMLLEVSFSKAVLAALVEIGMLTAMTSLLLFLVRHPGRMVQTLTALLGTGCVITVLSVPFVYWIVTAQARELDVSLPILFLLILGGWNLGIVAYILRHALNVGMGMGLVLALAFAIASFSVSYHLFPPQQEEPLTMEAS